MLLNAKGNTVRDFHISEINTRRVAVSVRISDPIIHMRQHSPIYSSSFPAVRACRTGKLQQFDESGNRMGGGCPFMSKEQGMDFQVRSRTVQWAIRVQLRVHKCAFGNSRFYPSHREHFVA